MIEARGLTKRFGRTTAVDDLTFSVRPGVVTGFLGPNGAGKSTTMRMAVGLDWPSAGTITVNGHAYRRLPAPPTEVGVMLEARAAHTGRSAYKHLLVMAQTQGLPRHRVDEVLDLVGLTDVAGKRVGTFSLGMGQRLGIAAAMLGDPGVLILDEPVNGLDPEGIRWIRQLLQGLAAEGRTVFLSSHLISEIAATATRLIVVGRGRLLADTTVYEAVRSASGDIVHVRSPQRDRLAKVLTADGASVIVTGRNTLDVDGRTAEQIGEAASAAGITVFGLAPRKASLEDVFLDITRDAVEYRQDHRPAETVAAGARDARAGKGVTTTGSAERTPVQPAPEQRVRPASHRDTKVTILRVLHSEWTKLTSLRSTLWTLLAAIVLTIGAGDFVCWTAVSPLVATYNASGSSFDPVVQSIVGAYLAEVAIGVLGVLTITGEYATGMIRTSFAMVPERLLVLYCKVAVFAVTSFGASLAAIVAAFFSGQAILGTRHMGVGIASPGTWRVLLGSAFFVTAVGLLGLSVGTIVRSTGAALASVLGMVFAVPLIVDQLPHPWNEVHKYLPDGAGEALVNTWTYGPVNLLSPFHGLLVLIIWLTVALCSAAFFLELRDA